MKLNNFFPFLLISGKLAHEFYFNFKSLLITENMGM